MKGIALYTYLLFYTAFAVVSVSSADSSEAVSIEINASTSQVTIGDSLSLFCKVTIPDDVTVIVPYLKDRSPYYDIEKQWEKTESSNSGTTTIKYGFLLYVFAPDTLRVGPFITGYINADDETIIAVSNTIVLPVTGVIENEESPPLPNRNPFAIASKGISIWLFILLLTLIALTVFAVLYFIYRKKTSLKPISEEPVDEINEFLRIKRLKLYESGRLKELYFLISSALRGFIHRNMEFDALCETTEEIVNELSRKSGDEKVNREINEILTESDRVKFAKYIPPPELSSSVIDRALEPVKAVLDEIARKKEQESAITHENKTKTFIDNQTVNSRK